MGYNKDDTLFAIDKFVRLNGRLPKSSDYRKLNGLPPIHIISHFFGKPKILLQQRYPELYAEEQAKRKNKCEEAYKERRGSTDKEFADEILKKIDEFVRKNKRVPKMSEYTVANGLTSKNTVIKYLGDINTLLKNRYPEYFLHKWDADRIRKSVEIFRIRHQRLPLMKEFSEKNNLPSITEFKKYCGDAYKTLKQWYPEFENPNRRIPKDEIFLMIDQFVEKNGRMPTVDEYREENGLPSYTTVKKRCGNNEQILNERYPHLVIHRRKWNEEKINKAFDEFVRKNGRLPRHKELIKKNFLPSIGQVKEYMGDLYIYMKKRYPEYELPKRRHGKGYWNENNIVEAVSEFKDRNGRIPLSKELGVKNSLPSQKVIVQKFGGWKIFCEKYFPEEYYARRKACPCIQKAEGWNEEKVLKAIETFIEKNGRLPQVKEFLTKNDLPSATWMRNHLCQSISSFLKVKYSYMIPKVSELSKDKTRTAWDREKVIEAIDEFVLQNQRLPMSDEFRKKNNLPCLPIFIKQTGYKLNEFFKQRYPELYQERLEQKEGSWTEKKIYESIKRFVDKNGRLPQFKEFRLSNELPSISVFTNHCGISTKKYFKKYFPDQVSVVQRPQKWTKEVILKSIKDFVVKNGNLPTVEEFIPKNDLPSMATVTRTFGGLRNALREYAKIEQINYMSHPEWNEDSILRALDEFVAKHKCLPKCNDATRQNGMPTVSTVIRYFGSWSKLLHKRYPQYETQDTRKNCKNHENEADIIQAAIENYVKENDLIPSVKTIFEITGIRYNAIVKSLGMTKDEYCRKVYPHYYETEEKQVNESEETICMVM